MPVLTRALLEAGGAREIYERDAPGIRLTTEAERATCLAATLARRPRGEVWVFGYGSLIWNPALKAVGRRTARVDGWHRAFCMSIVAGRARPAAPGLMLALDAGGYCCGTAYRLHEDDVVAELTMLWRREMLCRDAYVPTWVEYVRHNQRRTMADAETTDRLLALHRGKEKPRVHRMIERQAIPPTDDVFHKPHIEPH